MRRWLACALVAASLCTAGVAVAQPRRPVDLAAKRAAIKDRIRAMRVGELTVALDLNAAMAARLFPLLARYDDEIDRLVELRQDINQRLRDVDRIRDPRKIEALIDESAANERAFAELEQRRIADLRKVLTPPQVAKTLVVLPAFETRIRKQIMNALNKAHRAAAPDDDDDREGDEAPPPRPRKGPAPCDPYASPHGRC